MRVLPSTPWIAALLALTFLSSCSTSHFEPPKRLGPPLLVTDEKEPRLWLLVKQEEKKQISSGFSRRTTGSIITETRYHFDLQCHDTRTAERLWKTRLLTLKDKEGGHSAQARILGQDGGVVWLFLHDGPFAVAAVDGAVLADRPQLEQRNPSFQGLVPKELNFYTFDKGLVITTADARRHKIAMPNFGAEPYQPPSEEYFTRAQFMSTTWKGGYRTDDFLTRQARLSGKWLGFYTEKEAADAGDDGFGDSLKNPSSIVNEGSRARRTLWTARIGRTKEFSEGSHDRLFDLTRAPGASDYLEAGLLIKQGTKDPLLLHEPDGLLVLHRTRLDAEGRLALTRLDESLRENWTTPLPFLELGNRYEFPDRLLMYGALQLTEKGITSWEESLVALALRDGRAQAWNVTLERAIP